MKHKRKTELRPLIWWQWVIIVPTAVILGIALLYGGADLEYAVRHRAEKFSVGVTFSYKYSEELGLNAKETMSSLINDVGVRQFRLMSYWDLHEPVQGQYDFTQLDWQMKLAEESGSKVTLAIGMRQPRWPECHVPEWADKLPKDQQYAALEAFMLQTIQRYKSSPALWSYQLENEALNNAFGACKDFNRERLVKEFNLVKQADPVHPVVISVSNEIGYPIGEPKGDIVGFSVYHKVFDGRVLHNYIEYPFPSWYHGGRGGIIELYSGHPIIIHELQAEPWGPVGTSKMSFEDQNISMDANRLKQRVQYAEGMPIHYFDLWGAEWWYWRKVKFNDPSLLDAAKEIFKQHS
jgi:hypothetical protein